MGRAASNVGLNADLVTLTVVNAALLQSQSWAVECGCPKCHPVANEGVIVLLSLEEQTLIEVRAALFVLLTNGEETTAAINFCVVAGAGWL